MQQTGFSLQFRKFLDSWIPDPPILHNFNIITEFSKLHTSGRCMGCWVAFVLTQFWLCSSIFVLYNLKYAGSRAGTDKEPDTASVRCKSLQHEEILGSSKEPISALLWLCGLKLSSHHNNASFNNDHYWCKKPGAEIQCEYDWDFKLISHKKCAVTRYQRQVAITQPRLNSKQNSCGQYLHIL